MSAKETAKTTNTTAVSTDSGKVIVVTKASWYKEASGVVAVTGWLLVIFLWTYAILTGQILEQWWWLLALVVVSLTAAMFRQNSARITVENVEL